MADEYICSRSFGAMVARFSANVRTSLAGKNAQLFAYYFGLAQCIHFGEHFNMGWDTKSLSESQGDHEHII